ncbi:MAG: oligosaccharide flippase family protein [Candidatus Omnitrophota bacterium]
MIKTNFKKQLPLNLFSNVGYFALNVVVGIWMVPYLIRHLGVAGYGFIPLASSATAYVSLITLALNGAVSRFLVIALHKNDIDGANKIFNTAFWSLALLLVILVPLSGVFSWLTPRIFNVPVNLTSQVQWLFFLMLLSFIVSVFSSVFSVSTFAHNRLDLRNLVDMSNISVRTALVVSLFVFLSISLVSVGVAYLVGGLMSLGLGYFLFRKLTPLLKISRQYFDFSRLRELTSMGGWLVVDQIGSLLFLQVDLMVANILFGAHKAGQYGAILQWSFLLRSLAGVIASVLTPMVFISHAKDETQRIVSMSQRAVKFMGLGIAVPVGLLCGFAVPLLTLWLGQDYAPFASLLWVLTFHLVVNLAVLPLFAINNALNRVKIPGRVTLVMGTGNLFLAVILAKFCGWGLYGIAAAGAITLTLKNTFFIPIYAAHILKLSSMTFLKPISRGILLAGISMAIGWIFSHTIMIDGWPKLLLMGGLAFLFAVTVGFGLLGKDRGSLRSAFAVRSQE